MFFFGKIIVVFVCSILSIVSFGVCLCCKKKSKTISMILCFCIVAVSVFVPVRMFFGKREFTPTYEMSNPDILFERFNKMFDYGEQQLNIQKPTNSYGDRMIFVSGDNFEYEVETTIFRYFKDENSDDFITDLKNSAVDIGGKNGIKYWRSNLVCNTISEYSAFCGTGGSIVLEDEAGEVLVIIYDFRNFKKASNIFPSCPEEFTDALMLTFDPETDNPWALD